MKTLHIGNYIYHEEEKPELFEEITLAINNDNWDVEVYPLSMRDEHLPEDCEVVGYRSRETLAIFKDGVLLDSDEMEKESNLRGLIQNVEYPEEFVRRHYEDIEELFIGFDFDAILERLKEIWEGEKQ